MNIVDLVKIHLEERLPVETFSVSDELSPNGRCITIRPTNPEAAQMTFWIADISPIDLLLGKAFATELEQSDTQRLIAMVDAVIAGQLKDHIWTICGRTIYSRSKVITHQGTMTVRNGIPFAYPPWLRHDRSYAPYN